MRRQVCGVRMAVLLAGVLVVPLAGAAGCRGTPDPISEPTPSSSLSTAATSSPSTSPSAPSSAPTVDPEHSVPTPPAWSGRVLPPDLLVYATDPLSPDTIAAIQAVKGVTDVESISMAQVTVENQGLNVVGVDPATYRRYAPVDSATLDEQWDRVANGEMALVPSLGERLMNPDGYLQLGTVATSPLLHVGALAPQIPQVDAVINEKWAAELDMPVGNALIVATDETSPQSVRPKIARLAGSGASVQILTVNLDTSVRQTAVLVGSVGDAVGTFNYSVLAGGRIAPDPAWVASHISTESVPLLGSVTCNTLIFPQLRAALSEVVRSGLSDAIHPREFAGCYYPRFIAGTTKLSNHSFGLALDLNTPGNQRGTVGEMDRRVVAIFKDWGFAWGGDWSYTDPMHFEMNALVAPG